MDEVNKSDRHRLSRQQIIPHVQKSLLFTPFDVKWCPNSATFTLIGQHPNNNGALIFYRLQKGGVLDVINEFRLKTPLKCLTYGHSPSGADVALGDFIGGLQLINIERLLSGPTTIEEAQHWYSPRAHELIINCIDGARFNGPPELVTGSRDGAVRVFDVRQKEKAVMNFAPIDSTRARDCWAVSFGNSFDVDERVIAAGFDNGDVKLFDLRAQKVRHEMNIGNGVCGVEFDRKDIEMNKLIAASLEGKVRVCDLRTLHPKLGYAFVEDIVTSGTVWCAKALPQNREVFISGGGGELTLSRYHYPPERHVKDNEGIPRGVAGSIEELNKVKVGDQPINSIDWNRDKEGLLVCTSFDQSVKVMLVTKLSLIQ